MGFYTHRVRVGISGRRFSFIRRMNSFSRLVVFHVEDARYAVRLEDVERVVAAVELVPLPDAPDLVLGVFNLQGNVVPAIDTRRRLRLPARETGVSDQFLVVRAAGRAGCCSASGGALLGAVSSTGPCWGLGARGERCSSGACSGRRIGPGCSGGAISCARSQGIMGLAGPWRSP